MEQMLTVLFITALVAVVTGVLIPMLSGPVPSERPSEREQVH